MANEWFVYVLECADGTLYTGVTTDVERRVREHARGRGARYTRGRTPLRVLYVEGAPDRAAALRRESEIKRMPRGRKMTLGLPAASATTAAATGDG